MKIRLLLTLALTATGCVATDVGNPQTEESVVQVEMQAFEEADPRALMLDDGVEITHIWVAVDEVRLDPCELETETEEMDTDTETDSETEAGEEVRMGPVVADLVSGTTFPESILLRESTTRFCAFQFRVGPLDPAELPAAAPTELSGRSVLIRGTLKDGNPFVVESTLDETLELEGDLELDTEVVTSYALGFAVNGWVTQRQLGALSGDPIRIDAESTPEVYASFEEAFINSPRLFAGEIGGTIVAE